jgi:signal transduction histidine kinase
MSAKRPTVRGRLALLLAALIVLTGVVLLAASYGLVNANLNYDAPKSLNYGVSTGTGPRTPSPGVSVVGSRGATEQGLSTAADTVRSQIAHHERAALLVQYGAILAALALLAALVAWLISGRILRPLRTITTTAKRIGRERLHERLALAGPRDELTELGDTFDSMLGRLEVAFQDQQLFAANAAHELRTPLGVMHAELDLALSGPDLSAREQRRLLARLRRTVLASERLTERLLSLTRGQVMPAEREPVEIDKLARQRLAIADTAAQQQGLTVHHELKPAVADGDPGLLTQLLDNLIENAIRHNQPSGWIQLSTRSARDQVVLEVTNSGQELADEELVALTEPFRRASQQRVGHSTGLGLTIVRTIVAAHDGQLALQAPTGGGLRVTITLPAASGKAEPDIAASRNDSNVAT